MWSEWGDFIVAQLLGIGCVLLIVGLGVGLLLAGLIASFIR